MKGKNITICVLFFFVFTTTILKAQQATDVAGGDATGTSGKLSYSIGQVSYLSATGTSGRISEGVQQPYEFFSVGIKELESVSMQFQVYPNPTSSSVNVKIENYNLENVKINLYDIRGRLILSERVENPNTNISLDGLTDANYYLTIFDLGKELRSFQIIKN